MELVVPTLEPSKNEVWQVAFSPDGKRLASCGTDEAVYIWDVEHLLLMKQLPGHTKTGIGNLAWGPDSKLLVTCSLEHTAKLWNTDVSSAP